MGSLHLFTIGKALHNAELKGSNQKFIRILHYIF